MTNWKHLVEKTQEKLYVLPEGWDSKETVAQQIGCSPERVSQLLAPAVKARTVEVRAFPVWDKVTKRVNRVTAYRETKKAS